jgi:hypothetical protein
VEDAAAGGVEGEDGVGECVEDGVEAGASAQELFLGAAFEEGIHLLHLSGGDIEGAFEEHASVFGVLIRGVDDVEQRGPLLSVGRSVCGELEASELLSEERVKIHDLFRPRAGR